MAIADAHDDALVRLMKGDQLIDHMLVPFVDQGAFDRREFLTDFLDVRIEVFLIVFQFRLHPFFGDKEPSESGQQKSEFFHERHGLPHVDEELLCVDVDEGDWELMALRVRNRSNHLVASVHAVLLCHAFLELREQPIDHRQVLFRVLVRLGVGVALEYCLVALRVKFDADDLRFFLIKDGKDGC